jgi:signal transduction histidine kinase/streptogramin lyase
MNDLLENITIRSIFEDENGKFWLGGNKGQLLFLDLKNEVFNKYIIDSSAVDPVVDNIIKDSENQIWVSGRGLGVHKIDPINNTRVKLSSSNGLISDQVYSMMEDDQGNIWLATHKGVQVIDISKKEIITFTTAEGLGANDVYDIIEQEGKILLGTSKGLTIIKEKEIKGKDEHFYEVKTLGNKQGLDHIDFHMNSFSIDKKGRLWSGVDRQILTIIDELNLDTIAYDPSITGINIFDKRQIFQNVKFINESYAKEDTILVGDKNELYVQSEVGVDSTESTSLIRDNILWESVEGPHDLPVGLTLPHNQNYLSFNYNGAQFSNPDKVVYRYILEGIDKNWSPISDKTTSENYRDLPPGDYNFKVASKGFNGIWSKPAEFEFVITPPWWQTWWAFAIFVALFLGLGLVILNYRSKWLKKENRILEERVNHRTAQLKKTIEELENTQSQLIHSEKMASLGELTAGIAHEIQNPMNFINNFSEVSIELIDEMREEMDKGELEEAKSISKDIAQNLDKITHHGKRASSIVKGMLEHSRNTSGQKELTDINVLADEYLRLAYHGLRAKNKSFNADFKTDLDESLSKIEVIPQDLGRVLLNLINNAFYAVTARAEEEKDPNYKPQVTISTKKLKDQVIITIKDNGMGIPKEIKDKIFQPFFTTKPTGKGTGLGLSLAYDIVTQGHGGALELNTKPGEGTEFLIYIPIVKS